MGYVLDELIVDGVVCETDMKEVCELISKMDSIP
jgi:hypothetical protein